MKNIKKQLQYALLVFITMMTVSAAGPVVSTADAACKERVWTFPTWYSGVVDGKCDIKITKLSDFWVIAMNAIEILLQVVAYVSSAFLIWGGFKFIKSEGDPSKVAEARLAIRNAIVGLVIALISVAIVELIQGSII